MMTMRAKSAELYGAAVQQPSMTQRLLRDLNKPVQTTASSKKTRNCFSNDQTPGHTGLWQTGFPQPRQLSKQHIQRSNTQILMHIPMGLLVQPSLTCSSLNVDCCFAT